MKIIKNINPLPLIIEKNWWNITMNRILILFTIFERGKSYLDDQPRIETINGDLKFTTGTSKNIIFETLSGTILLNGDDISETIASFSMQIDQHAE